MTSSGETRRRRGADTVRLDGVSDTNAACEAAARDLTLCLTAIEATLALAARHPADDELKREAGRAIDVARRLASAQAELVRGRRGDKAWVELGALVRHRP